MSAPQSGHRSLRHRRFHRHEPRTAVVPRAGVSRLHDREPHVLSVQYDDPLATLRQAFEQGLGLVALDTDHLVPFGVHLSYLSAPSRPRPRPDATSSSDALVGWFPAGTERQTSEPAPPNSATLHRAPGRA